MYKRQACACISCSRVCARRLSAELRSVRSASRSPHITPVSYTHLDVYKRQRYAGVHGDDNANNELLLRRMRGKTQRDCAFVSAIALARPGEKTLIAEGTCPGKLLDAPRGNGGFGYDPLFLYENGETFAEMSQETKNLSLIHI